jgi:hypothetical protein
MTSNMEGRLEVNDGEAREGGACEGASDGIDDSVREDFG